MRTMDDFLSELRPFLEIENIFGITYEEVSEFLNTINWDAFKDALEEYKELHENVEFVYDDHFGDVMYNVIKNADKLKKEFLAYKRISEDEFNVMDHKDDILNLFKTFFFLYSHIKTDDIDKSLIILWENIEMEYPIICYCYKSLYFPITKPIATKVLWEGSKRIIYNYKNYPSTEMNSPTYLQFFVSLYRFLDSNYCSETAVYYDDIDIKSDRVIVKFIVC